MAMDVTAEVEIERAPEDAARYAFEPSNDPEWIGGIKRAEMITEPPVREGTRVSRAAQFMGRKIEYVLEVVRMEPGRVLDMKSIKSPFPMEVTYRFEPAGEGRTRASIHIGGDSGGFYRLMAPVTSMMVKRNITGDLKRLKQILESRQ